MLQWHPGPRRDSQPPPDESYYVRLEPGAPRLRLSLVPAMLVCAVSCAIGQTGPSGCTATAQGALPTGTYTANRVVTLIANCGPGGFASVDWGDQTGSTSGPSPLTANHTYPAGASVSPPYSVQINQVPSLYLTFPTAIGPFSTFSGQASTATSPITAEKPVSVIVVCQSVFDLSGNVYTPQQLNITCSSPDLPATVPAFPSSIAVRVVVSTSGIARLQRPTDFRHEAVFACMTFPLLGIMSFTERKKLRAIRTMLAMAVMLCLALAPISCGGGFTTPRVGAITPSGQYQVVAVTELAPGSTDPTFVQTTLIVPLTVAPTQ